MKPQYDKDQGMQINGNFWQVHPKTCEPWTEESVAEFLENYQSNDDLAQQLEAAQQQAINQIKRQAKERLKTLDWKVQRAKDRIVSAELRCDETSPELTAAESELLLVLQQRESIRAQSDEAEAQVKTLTSLAEVAEFSW